MYQASCPRRKTQNFCPKSVAIAAATVANPCVTTAESPGRFTNSPMLTTLAIIAGALAPRLAEETDVRSKLLIEIGRPPILWQVMKCYSAHALRKV